MQISSNTALDANTSRKVWKRVASPNPSSACLYPSTGLSWDRLPTKLRRVDFEWDEAKNQENLRKHGFDFSDGWEVFEAPLLIAPDTRIDYGEERWIGIGLLGNRIVVITFVEREGETIRIVSLRKALKHERNKFEEAIRDGLGAH